MSTRNGGESAHEQPGDTQGFEALSSTEGVEERKEFELLGNYQAQVKEEFQHPIELRLGRDERTPTLYVVRHPSHRVSAPTYAVIQPEVVRAYPGRGWVEFKRWDEAVVQLGRGVSPQFELGPDVSRRHCLLAANGISEIDGLSNVLEIENYGRNGLRILVHPDDLEGDVRPFDPKDAWE